LALWPMLARTSRTPSPPLPILHEGDPIKGRHGILLKGGSNADFIPFFYCKTSRLWYIKLEKPKPAVTKKLNKHLGKMAKTAAQGDDSAILLRERKEYERTLFTQTSDIPTQTPSTSAAASFSSIPPSASAPATRSSMRGALIAKGLRALNEVSTGTGRNSAFNVAFKPKPPVKPRIDMRDIQPELDNLTSDSDHDSDTDSASSSEELDEIAAKRTAQSDKYLKDPTSFADYDDFTNSTQTEMDANDRYYEEQLRHKRSDIKDIYLYSTSERVKGTRAQAILMRWHIASGHVNPRYLIKLAKNIKGMEEVARLDPNTPLPVCHTCRKAK